MAHRPYPIPDRARHQLDRRARRRPIVDAQWEAVFARNCADAAASIDRQFQWMPARVALPIEGPLTYEACRNLVDAVYRERHGLRRSSR